MGCLGSDCEFACKLYLCDSFRCLNWIVSLYGRFDLFLVVLGFFAAFSLCFLSFRFLCLLCLGLFVYFDLMLACHLG